MRWRWNKKDIGGNDVIDTSPVLYSALSLGDASSATRGYSANNAVIEGLQGDAATWAAIDTMALALATLPAQVMRGSRQRPEDSVQVDHPLALRLNDKANLWESALNWRYRHAIQLLISEWGTFTVIGDDLTLGLLDPRATRAVIEDGMVSHFEIRTGANVVRLDKDLVVWHRKPHPFALDGALVGMRAVADAIDVARKGLEFQEAWLDNDGAISLLVLSEMGLLDQEADRVRARFARGERGRDRRKGAGRIEFVGGLSSPQIVELNKTPKDASYMGGRKAAQDETFLGLGTPRSIAGDASGRTFDNAAAEEAIFYRSKVLPLSLMIATEWDRVLEDGLYLSFASGEIDALKRANEALAPNLTQLVNAKIITQNEARARLGMEAVEGGDELDPPTTFERRELARPQKLFAGRLIEAERIEKARVRIERRRRISEAFFSARISGYFARQRSIVLTKLQGAKSRKAFAETKIVDPARLIDAATWDRLLEAEMAEWLNVLIAEAGGRTAALLGSSFTSDTTAIQELIKARQVGLIDPVSGAGLNHRIAEEIRLTLADATSAGEGIAQMAERIEALYGEYEGWQSERIARTETGAATNGADIEAARQSGVVSSKVWLAVGDHRTRETHIEADGQSVPVDTPFILGGLETDMPGMTGEPGEDINCRCTALFEGDELGVEDQLPEVE